MLVDINKNEIHYGEHVAKVYPQIAELVYVLANNWPKASTPRMLVDAVWGITQKDDAYNNLRVHISRARAVLMPWNVFITNRWGDGYVLEFPQSKQERKDAELFPRDNVYGIRRYLSQSR